MIHVTLIAYSIELFKFLVPGLFCAGCLNAQEPVYSGPQPGEAIAHFEVRSLSDAEAGKQIDYVANANGKPLLLVFVHDINRQSIAMVRNLTTYSAKRKQDGLETGVVLLSDDANEPIPGAMHLGFFHAPGFLPCNLGIFNSLGEPPLFDAFY